MVNYTMLGRSDVPKEWAERLKNLEKRFPAVERFKIVRALHKFRGHAGKVARSLSPCPSAKHKREPFMHPVELSGRLLFSSAMQKTHRDATLAAKRLGVLRKELGKPVFALKTSKKHTNSDGECLDHAWTCNVYKDNGKMEEDLRIQRASFGRKYSESSVCLFEDIFPEKCPTFESDLRPWSTHPEAFATLKRWFQGCRGKIAWWDRSAEKGFLHGSTRFVAVARLHRIVIEWYVKDLGKEQ